MSEGPHETPEAPSEPGLDESERGLIHTAISRPVAVSVGAILVLVFGITAVGSLPIQLTPDLTVPTITVSTAWPGASPIEVEADIIEPQEDALKSLPGLQRMTSEMRQSQGSITLELAVGADLEQAAVRVTNLLTQVSRYPDAAREPVISTANSAGPPLAVIVVQSPVGLDVAEYQSWLLEEITPQLDRIEGVAGTRVFGGRDREVQIDFDPAELAARGLNAAMLARALRAELTDVSAGDVTVGKRRRVVRTTVAPNAPIDLEAVVVGTGKNGTPIHLGDIARVHDGLRKATGFGLADGRPSLAMLLSREAGSNVLEVTKEIRRVVDELQESRLAPEGLEMRIVSDQVDYIEEALELLRDNLLLGSVFTVAVLLLFLRSVGASLIISIAIPISIIGTALGMALLGRNINLVSLSGTAFAVGMVVDSAIVVLENIDSWRARGASAARAALLGTREVWGALIASTATTAAVFLPIIAWQDEVGDLLRDVSISIALAVSISFVVSTLVIPSLSARLLRKKTTGNLAESLDERGLPRPRDGYIRRLVERITARPLAAVLVTIIGVGGPIALGLAIIPPLEYLPSGNRNVVFGVVLPPAGASVESARALGEIVQGRLVAHIGKDIGEDPAVERTFFFGGADSAFMGAVAVDPARIDDLERLVRKTQSGLPDVIAFASKAGLFDRRAGSGRAIEIDVLGADQDAARALGGQLMGALSAALPGAQIRPIPGLDPGAPEDHVVPRRDRMQSLGVATSDLGLIVDAHIDGAIIGEVGRRGEPKRDLLLRSNADAPLDSVAFGAIPVATPSGVTVPMSELAELQADIGPTVLQRIERSRALTLAITPPREMALETALDTTRATIAALSGGIPAGLRVELAGSADKLDAATERLVDVLILAIIITYLLLAGLFENWLAPISILVSVPLAGVGGLLALEAVNAFLGPQPLDMMTALGFIILIGTVVNNAILVVDGALTRIRAGEALSLAIAAATQQRVRPILMTTATTVSGLLPLVLFPGAGSELYRGVGAVVLGGLVFSTVLTLVVVPALFSLIARVRSPVRLKDMTNRPDDAPLAA